MNKKELYALLATILIIGFTIILALALMPLFPKSDYMAPMEKPENTTTEINATEENIPINFCYNKIEYIAVGSFTKYICYEEYILRKDGFYDKVEKNCTQMKYLEICNDYNINCMVADEIFYEKRVTQECPDPTERETKYELKFFNNTSQ